MGKTWSWLLASTHKRYRVQTQILSIRRYLSIGLKRRLNNATTWKPKLVLLVKAKSKLTQVCVWSSHWFSKSWIEMKDIHLVAPIVKKPPEAYMIEIWCLYPPSCTKQAFKVFNVWNMLWNVFKRFFLIHFCHFCKLKKIKIAKTIATESTPLETCPLSYKSKWMCGFGVNTNLWVSFIVLHKDKGRQNLDNCSVVL